MTARGPLHTPYEDCAVEPPRPTTRDGASFGTPMPNAKEPTDDKFGGGVQFDRVGSDSSKPSK